MGTGYGTMHFSIRTSLVMFCNCGMFLSIFLFFFLLLLWLLFSLGMCDGGLLDLKVT